MLASKISGRDLDPITFEILSHRLNQITVEMGVTLERVGGTANTTQMKDYMAALYLPNGDVLSAGTTMAYHAACAGFAVKCIIDRFENYGRIEPDDVFVLNDPYLAAIHQSDVYVISPHPPPRPVGGLECHFRTRHGHWGDVPGRQLAGSHRDISRRGKNPRSETGGPRDA